MSKVNRSISTDCAYLFRKKTDNDQITEHGLKPSTFIVDKMLKYDIRVQDLIDYIRNEKCVNKDVTHRVSNFIKESWECLN